MKQMITLLGIGLLTTTYSPAQVFYHDINPDTTMGGGATLQYFSFSPPATYPSFETFWDPSQSVYIEVHGLSGYGAILYDNNAPSKLEAGNMIGPSSGAWVEGHGSLYENGIGNWQTNATDKYLGFRFKKPTGADWYYGWLRLTIAPAAASFTVKAWAYQTQENVAIAAGDASASGVIAVNYNNDIRLVTKNNTVYFMNLEPGRRYMVVIADLNGRTVRTRSIIEEENIEIADLPGGTYILQIAEPGGRKANFKMSVL